MTAQRLRICLSKIHKAEKIELSKDRLIAGSTKLYKMVRANRAYQIGMVYREGDVEVPIGYDRNSYAYRDVGYANISLH